MYISTSTATGGSDFADEKHGTYSRSPPASIFILIASGSAEDDPLIAFTREKGRANPPEDEKVLLKTHLKLATA